MLSQRSVVVVNDENLIPEVQHCIDALDYLLKYKDHAEVVDVMNRLITRCREAGVSAPFSVNTAYINTIPVDEQPDYPGDIEIEKTIEDIIRWNAMAMVVKANRTHDGIGGHISSFASCATLYEVGFNHIFRGNGDGHDADQVFFQGHTSPGNYSRSYVEGRLSAKKLHHFRQELAVGGGLSSYPHPYLMPNYWQFPTVSMGLGPLMAIYQARFNRYMSARGVLKEDETQVWCFVGDGECDEPETLGSLTLASRDQLDNLNFIVGKVEDTLYSDKIPNKIALLRLDTDWYESTKIELEVLYPLLSSGGILIVDDYGHFEGARKAVDEYFSKFDKKPYIHRIDYTARIIIKQ